MSGRIAPAELDGNPDYEADPDGDQAELIASYDREHPPNNRANQHRHKPEHARHYYIPLALRGAVALFVLLTETHDNFLS